MAVIISVLNQKGGVGKSTITLNLAVALQELPARVLVVDCDSQETSLKLAAGAPEELPFPVAVVSMHGAGSRLGEMLRPLAENYDYLIIDGPPSHFAQVSRAAAACSNLILLPTVPSKPDLIATKETAQLLKELDDRLGLGLHVYLVVNQAEKTRMKRVFDDAVRNRDEVPYPVLSSEIRKRTAFREAQAIGSHVLDSGDAEAAKDLRALRDEVLALIADQKEPE